MTKHVPAVASLPLDQVRWTTLKGKTHKVRKACFAKTWQSGGSLCSFIGSLPEILAGKDFKEVVRRIVTAKKSGKMVLLGMGAHPVKVGLNPVLIDWMEKGILKGVAMNGAGAIHDLELAMAGHTSEEVETELSRGTFGMVKETHQMVNLAIREGDGEGLGVGQALGRKIFEEDLRFKDLSLLSAGWRLGIPVTVHVAIGTDITHMGPFADGAAIGRGSLRDFHTFAAIVSGLEKGVYINLGSAVILPEVFLKALALAKNLGHSVTDITTVNMDFISHYRPSVNVVKRPTMKGGKGYTLIGHHEIMFPLLAAAVLEMLELSSHP